jgi:hypothetical protein
MCWGFTEYDVFPGKICVSNSYNNELKKLNSTLFTNPNVKSQMFLYNNEKKQAEVYSFPEINCRGNFLQINFIPLDTCIPAFNAFVQVKKSL